MGLGVLEPKDFPRPPGTVALESKKLILTASDAPEFAHFKKDGDIILQPQPDDSPNDPLNWPTKVKVGIFTTLVVALTAVNGVQTMLGTSFRILAERYHVSYPKVVQTVVPPGLASAAIALFISSAVAAVWGKRLPVVVGVSLTWINMLAGYFANSLQYYQAVNLVSWAAGSAAELMMAPVITDLAFVHQRGRFLALSATIGIIGSDLAHVIAGNVIAKVGVKYIYIISFGVLAPITVATFVFVRETTYTRKARPILPLPAGSSVTDRSSDTDYDKSGVTTKTEEADLTSAPNPTKDGALEPSSEKADVAVTPAAVPGANGEEPDTGANDPKHPWTWYLALYRGRLTDRRFFVALFQPVPLLLYPSVLFSVVVNGAMLCWALMSSVIAQQVLLYPPYDLKPDILAYIGLPGSLASFLGSIIAGYISDWLVRKMAQRNKGIYEPEFRLVTLIPATILSSAGFFVLGPLWARHAKVWEIVMTGLLFYFGGPFGSAACVAYVFDTMNSTSTEAFVIISLFRLLYGFLVAMYVPHWFEQVGPIKVYRTLGLLNLAFAAMGIPMYLYGKRLRAMCARSAFLHKMARSDKR